MLETLGSERVEHIHIVQLVWMRYFISCVQTKQRARPSRAGFIPLKFNGVSLYLCPSKARACPCEQILLTFLFLVWPFFRSQVTDQTHAHWERQTCDHKASEKYVGLWNVSSLRLIAILLLPCLWIKVTNQNQWRETRDHASLIGPSLMMMDEVRQKLIIDDDGDWRMMERVSEWGFNSPLSIELKDIGCTIIET